MEDFTQEDVVQALGNLNAMQLVKLTKQLEEKWGIRAEAPLCVPAGNVCSGCGQIITSAHACPGKPDLQTEFSITLVSFPPDKKMTLVKLVRELLGLGLLESKTLVESVPKILKEGISKEDADNLKTKLTEAGGIVEIK